MTKNKRKLAAIVFTDIVGFTALSATNQDKAADLLKLQRETLKPLVSKHNGDWIKEMGDGLLLIFDTVMEAVECCVEIQKSTKSINDLNLRIGIHQGEILIDGDDVIGDDVNIASRAEPFSEPGGIVVTDRINASLMRDPVYKTKLIGKPSLKGVRQEISLFCIISHDLPKTNISRIASKLEVSDKKLGLLGGFELIQEKREQPSYSTMTTIIGGTIVAILLVIGIIFVKNSSSIISSNNKGKSIAVLPFVNMSSDKENEYFSDGITEEILNYLAKIKNLRVISRTSVFTYKGRKDISIAEIGHELDVSHVLEGSVRKSGSKVRITAQLIRSADDAHLWSESFDRNLEDIFLLQDEIAQTIVETLKMEYIGHTNEQQPKKTETNIDAYNMYLQGKHFQNHRDEEGMKIALSFFKKTVQLDPEYELAYVGLANTYLLLADYGYGSFDENLPLAEYNANIAMNLNPTSAEVYAANAYVSLIRKDDPQKTESYYLKAIELNPNYARAHHWYSDFLKIVMKDYKRSLFHGKEAQKLDPLSGIIGINLAKTQISLNQMDHAESTLKNIIKVHPEFLQAFISLSNLYMSKGQWHESEMMAKKATDIKPDDGVSWKTLAEILIVQGKTSEGINAYKKFLDLNPSSTMALEHLSVGYYFGRNFDKASKIINTIYDQTTFAPLANLVEGWILMQKKDYTGSLTVLQKSRNGFLGLSAFYEALALGAQGIIFAVQEDKEGVELIISELENFGESNGVKSMIGIIKLYSGDQSKGYKIIKDSILNDNPYIYFFIDPKLDRFKNDVRFIELLSLFNKETI